MRASRGRPAPPASSVEPVVLSDEAPRTTIDAEFTAFVRSHQQELLRTAWLLVGDAHRAEELTQTALVRTYGAWRRVRGGDPLAYARRVLVNLRTDSWRRGRREVLVEPDELSDRPDGGRAADDGLADRDLVVRVLSRLTRRQRTVLVLRHFVGLAEAEVAAELGVTVGTVKATGARAIARLRTEMGTEATGERPTPTPTGSAP